VESAAPYDLQIILRSGAEAPETSSSETYFAKINRLLPNGRLPDRADMLSSGLRSAESSPAERQNLR